MGSLLEEPARREAVVRQRIEEIREQIAGLGSRLEAEQDRLSRLLITEETVEEILGETAQLIQEPAGDAEVVDAAGMAELGARRESQALRLRPWAHMLGFRGHFPSKSRHYSTALGDLRGGRAVHRATEARERYGLAALGDETTLVLGHWRFAGSGYISGEAISAEDVRRRVALALAIAAEQAEREDG